MSIGDLVKHRIERIEAEADALQDLHPVGLTVWEIPDFRMFFSNMTVWFRIF